MFKKSLTILSLLLTICFSMEAQQYFSPFSQYGIGDLQTQSFSRYKAMGNASVAAMNDNMYTASNPASYALIHSFAFEAGVNAGNYHLQADTQKFKYSDANIPYLSLAVPSTDTSKNWGFSVGILPFSRVGYGIRSVSDTPASPFRTVQMINGVGQTTRVYLGTGFQLFRNFYVGANASYIFGNTDIIHRVTFPDSSDLNGAQRITHSNISDFNFDAGAIYSIKMKKYRSLNLGATVSLPKDLKSRKSVSVNELTTNQYKFVFQDSVFSGQDIRYTTYLPMMLSGGINYNYSDTWHIYADVKYTQWSHLAGASDVIGVSVGAEYMPGSDLTAGKFISYLGRIHYRAGFHYETGFNTPTMSIPSQWFASFGLGLPASKYVPKESSNSFVDIAFQYGSMSNGLALPAEIKQDYFLVTLGVHLFEPYWFQRPKID